MRLKSGYSREKDVEFEFVEFCMADLETIRRCNHCKAIDINGNLRDVKITSVKTWKRRPDIEIHWKYGLYEYGISLLTKDGFDGVVLGTATPIN